MGTGEKFETVDDYANSVDGHRTFANAWVGTTEMHESQLDDQETQHIIEPADPAGKERCDVSGKATWKNNCSERERPIGRTRAHVTCAAMRLGASCSFEQ